MHSLFLTTAKINSERWLAAFPEARVCVDAAPGEVEVNRETLVWLVLDDAWHEHLVQVSNAGAKVVVLTLNESAEEARRMIALGAVGYLHALSAPEQLRQVRNAIEYDGLWLGRELMRELLTRPSSVSTAVDVDALSARERSVAEAVAAGNSNKEVARLLGITERTVKAHLSACFEKLGVRDRTQLAVLLHPATQSQA
ncbi:response regulator transcription factor [Gilvimarinus algae]|uniref:Response regulator transcription factor n=1 Tax=Gilvimarinus algae TaxID=3058037 RepID=A0ABT8T8T4_9GAMM|nr:response regulator transcription factor [Gilvimarinus sp. SDUM040014]MDO3380554.1 response regulator transcription factor [Gilvimarinus sp. SDUM040014]